MMSMERGCPGGFVSSDERSGCRRLIRGHGAIECIITGGVRSLALRARGRPMLF